MIKANELRIGNWVIFLNLVEPEKYIQVSGKFMLGLTKDDYISRYYKPIPLTPEILKKAGFREVEPLLFSNRDFYIKENLGSLFYSANNMRIEIRSLHQLQNLYFALYGEELSISL